ncbi:trypsin-like serine protease [Aliikangiella sp. IMCC44632]
MKKILISIFVWIYSLNALAVVKRHDVSQDLYEVKSAPEFFVNMPHEGSGVLIEQQWILSAGHVIYYDGYEGKSIFVQGIENKIEKVIYHPDYIKQPENAFKENAKPLMEFLYGRVDLVLIKLSNPVTHVNPIARYYNSDEMGMRTTTYGTGALGTGLTGELLNTKSRRVLNHFNNHIEGVQGNYLKMRFDKPDKGLPLEGIHGSGDSGGPTVIEEKGQLYLIGIQAFRDYEGELKDFKGGLYGSVSVLCRVSAFNNWIDNTIQDETTKLTNQSSR